MGSLGQHRPGADPAPVRAPQSSALPPPRVAPFGAGGTDAPRQRCSPGAHQDSPRLIPKARGRRQRSQPEGCAPPQPLPVPTGPPSPSPPAAGVRSSSRAVASSRRAPIPPGGPGQGPAGWGYRAGVSDCGASAFLPPGSRRPCFASPPSSGSGHTGEPSCTAVPSSSTGRWGPCSRARRAVPKRHPPQPSRHPSSPALLRSPGGAAGAPTSPGRMPAAGEGREAAGAGSTQTPGGGGETPGVPAGSPHPRLGRILRWESCDRGKGKLSTTSLTWEREEEWGFTGFGLEEKG